MSVHGQWAKGFSFASIASFLLSEKKQPRINLGVDQDPGFGFGFEPGDDFRQWHFVDGDVFVRDAAALAFAG